MVAVIEESPGCTPKIIEEAFLVIHRFVSVSFLLILPTDALVERIFNAERLIITSYRLHLMCWSRFLQFSAINLPYAVKVELRGIPAHAWEQATAEVLLNDFYWINDLHPDNSSRQDVFRVVARRLVAVAGLHAEVM